jgi:hypothetical protein
MATHILQDWLQIYQFLQDIFALVATKSISALSSGYSQATCAFQGFTLK